MKHIPGSAQVGRALKAAVREVKTSIKRANQQASKLLARGDYDGAQALVDLARSVGTFQTEVEALYKRWRSLRRETRQVRGEKLEITPPWKLYVPILRVLAASGGVMAWDDVAKALSSGTDFQPLPGDAEVLRGKPRWVRAAYAARSGLVKQGFVEKRGSFEWRITNSGRKAAESGLPAKQ